MVFPLSCLIEAYRFGRLVALFLNMQRADRERKQWVLFGPDLENSHITRKVTKRAVFADKPIWHKTKTVGACLSKV